MSLGQQNKRLGREAVLAIEKERLDHPGNSESINAGTGEEPPARFGPSAQNCCPEPMQHSHRPVVQHERTRKSMKSWPALGLTVRLVLACSSADLAETVPGPTGAEPPAPRASPVVQPLL